jgi:hypothetical protein
MMVDIEQRIQYGLDPTLTRIKSIIMHTKLKDKLNLNFHEVYIQCGKHPTLTYGRCERHQCLVLSVST